jgi:hypothetical protein
MNYKDQTSNNPLIRMTRELQLREQDIKIVENENGM